jgi:hypothetical protein
MISRSVRLRMRHVSDESCRESQNTYFVFSNFFSLEKCAVVEKMWTNIVEWSRPQMTTWRLSIACWIPKATNTLRLCNTQCFSSSTMIERMLLSVTLSVHCLPCFLKFVYNQCLRVDTSSVHTLTCLF